ncbi:MAG: DNA glycosylase [Monoraphidium minutum]|nr:MAG: DNA glycosylase [Monoraphidium minutum]
MHLAASAAAPRPQPGAGPAAAAPPPAAALQWRLLGTPPSELTLDFTLPTGQSFRWRRTAPNEYTGVIGRRVVQLRQLPRDIAWRVAARGAGVPDDAAADADALSEYFNLGVGLGDLYEEWAAADARFAKVAPHIPGARMLRQDPVECLFQFICSQNNHISRWGPWGWERAPSPPSPPPAPVAAAAPAAAPAAAAFYAFPSLEQLAAASEEQLRGLGFGYRAKFIAGAVADLRARPGGGEAWLLSLRGSGAAAAAVALEELPGVGPKVAACVALFSLDAHDAIPVDTHVWALATKYYAPRLAGKALTKKLHPEVAAAFVGRFGPRAGWAHSVLFISDLRQTKGQLAAAEEAAEAAEAAAGEAAAGSAAEGAAVGGP